jgi:hypothetical protein
MSKSIETGESQMNLTEAERLIKNWRECTDRIRAVNDVANNLSPDSVVTVRVAKDGFHDQLELTPLETKMLMNILHNTIYEREQNLRERIVNELHIDVEA